MDDSLLNFSRVETDPFAGIPQDSNITATEFANESSWSHHAWMYAFMVAELVNFFLGLTAVVSDVLLIYFIFRYKRLRKSINLYIANYAIMNLCYYVVAPILLIFHVMFSLGYSYFYFVFSYIAMTENTCQIGSFFILMVLGLEWTFTVVKPIKMVNSLTVQIKFFGIYTILFLFLILGLLGCFFRFKILQSLPFYLMPFIIFPIIFIHYVRRQRILNKEQLKTEYALWVVTIGVGFFIPIFLLDLVLLSFDELFSSPLVMCIYLVEYILSFFATPAPFFILYYLIKWNKYFKMALDTTFKRSVRSYGADNLDDASDNEEIVQDAEPKNVESVVNGLSRSEIMVL